MRTSADVLQVLRHATYRNERPWLALGGDIVRELLRPSRIALLILLVATAARAGVPVERAVPPPARQAYADGRAWQTRNAARLGCFTQHTAALRSEDPSRVGDAERLCERLRRVHDR